MENSLKEKFSHFRLLITGYWNQDTESPEKGLTELLENSKQGLTNILSEMKEFLDNNLMTDQEKETFIKESAHIDLPEPNLDWLKAVARQIEEHLNS